MSGSIEDFIDSGGIAGGVVQQPIPQTTVVLQGEGEVTANTGTGIGATPALDELSNVDIETEGKINGSVLVYKTATNKWTSTINLNAQNMEGGEF